MKLFHLSDLHIGLKLKGYDLSEDMQYIFEQIARLAKERRPDAFVIAGDIYDKAVPSAEAVELFDGFVTLLREACPDAVIMMISGNHDNPSRINVFRGVLSKQGVYMIGMPPRLPEEHIEKLTLNDSFGPVNFYLLPFVRPSAVRMIVAKDENESLSYDEALRRLLAREDVDTAERNVLVSHQFYLPVGRKADELERSSSEIITVGNIDQVFADVLEPFDYAALGHIHKPMKVGSEFFRYCGTPIACSIDEAGQTKGVIEVNLGAKGDVTTEVLPLEPLRAVRDISGSLSELLSQPSEDYVRITITDNEEHDPLDMQDRLYNAFPHHLGLKRLNQQQNTPASLDLDQRRLSEFELCCEFLGDPSEEERELLKEIINSLLQGSGTEDEPSGEGNAV